MNSRQKAIKAAIAGPIKKSMHLGSKGAPGISYKELSPKEKYYRDNNNKRTSDRLKKFSESGYGRHLADRARRRGEE